MQKPVDFTEVNIQKLFGHEAAEDEDPIRLREYYFKGRTYEQVANDLPVRILVGHKGIGKSALFKVAIAEENEQKKLPILIQPNDIVNLGVGSADFLQIIRQWTEGLNEIITKKIFTSFGISNEKLSDFKNYGGMVLDFLAETFKNLKPINYNPAKEALIQQFLKTHKVTVFIDDLDRGWQGRKEDVTRISALLNAIRDISNDNRGISFKIALRSDVYYLVRTSDESTDKIEGSVIWHTWSNHEIFVLLIKRIETFFGRKVNEDMLLSTHQGELARYLRPIMEDRFRGEGLWNNAPMYRVLMSLIRKRPRDLVKLCTLAARRAYLNKSPQIFTEDFRAIFEEYSQGRVQDTINEFRSELPSIMQLIMNMKPNRKERTTREGYVYKTDGLLKKIENVMGLNQFQFTNGKKASRTELAAFLYKINFLTARKETHDGIIRKYFEENRYLFSSFTDFGFDWEVHPAYRWALQPDSPTDIYNTLQLSADEQ